MYTLNFIYTLLSIIKHVTNASVLSDKNFNLEDLNSKRKINTLIKQKMQIDVCKGAYEIKLYPTCDIETLSIL